MGYAHYLLPDGREAGYAVDAPCDAADCSTTVSRGLDALCGNAPDGHRDPDEPGCGRYHCERHQGPEAHDCPVGVCGLYSVCGDYVCGELPAHDGPHRDAYDDTEYTDTE